VCDLEISLMRRDWPTGAVAPKTKWHCDRFSSQYFSFLLTASFHHCSILISIDMLLLTGRSATSLFRLHDCGSPIFFLVYLYSVPPADQYVLLLSLERLYRTFAYPGPLSIRGMSHFDAEILPANNTGVKMSVATFKEIYILEKHTRPDWFQLTMQFYELQNSGRLNGTLSRCSLKSV